MSSNSYINCSIYLIGTHVAPNLTDISLAFISSGITFSSSLTFISNCGFSFANSFATFNFSLTFPDKYSSAVTYLFSSFDTSGIINICPSSSFISSFSVLSVSVSIYSISTLAFSLSETINASFAVSTLVTTFLAFIVFL